MTKRFETDRAPAVIAATFFAGAMVQVIAHASTPEPVKLDQKLKNLKDRETDEYKAFHSAPSQTEVPPGYGQDVPSYGEPF